MYYKKTETYTFSCPREYNAYLKFRDDLKETGITFSEENAGLSQIVKIIAGGRFDLDEDGDILKIGKEEY